MPVRMQAQVQVQVVAGKAWESIQLPSQWAAEHNSQSKWYPCFHAEERARGQERAVA